MQKYLKAYNDDLDDASSVFIDELETYSQAELVSAINDYLDTHDKCKEFAELLIKLNKNRLEKK
jgi:uncharacterized protein YpiB (UPF0302 family)